MQGMKSALTALTDTIRQAAAQHQPLCIRRERLALDLQHRQRLRRSGCCQQACKKSM